MIFTSAVTRCLARSRADVRLDGAKRKIGRFGLALESELKSVLLPTFCAGRRCRRKTHGGRPFTISLLERNWHAEAQRGRRARGHESPQNQAPLGRADAAAKSALGSRPSPPDLRGVSMYSSSPARRTRVNCTPQARLAEATGRVRLEFRRGQDPRVARQHRHRVDVRGVTKAAAGPFQQRIISHDGHSTRTHLTATRFARQATQRLPRVVMAEADAQHRMLLLDRRALSTSSLRSIHGARSVTLEAEPVTITPRSPPLRSARRCERRPPTKPTCQAPEGPFAPSQRSCRHAAACAVRARPNEDQKRRVVTPTG